MRGLWLSLLLSVGIALCPAPSAWAETPQATERPLVHITLLQLNDVYELTAMDHGKTGGLARVTTLIRRVEAENPNTFFVLGGDTLSPSIASRIFQGRQMIEAWNRMGLDVAVLGNHEFDYGDEVLQARIAESNFPWLGANVINQQTGQPIDGVRSAYIIDVEGVQLGFFGVLTPDTKNASHPGPDVTFQDPVSVACRTVSELRKAGTDVVVGLTHLTMNEDKRVARALGWPRLHVVMGGHEHTLLQSHAGGVPIFKVGSDARHLGRLDIWVDPGDDTVHSMDWRLIPVTADVPEDPAMAAWVAGYEAQMEAAMGQPVGETTVKLDAVQEHVRRHETNLGNFIADVYRAHYNADVALVNGGSIRSNTTYGPGRLTRRDVQSILPFGNKIILAEVRGAVLKAALENGVSRLGGEEAGRFPQVSGLTFAYNGERPVGNRVVSVQVGGQPLDPEKTYTLATSSYLLEGGDDYLVLKEARWLSDAQESPVEAALVEAVIQKQARISPVVEGRIRRLDEPDDDEDDEDGDDD